MRVVHISHLKACTVATQTTGTQGRHTALVRDLRQWVLLVHKLRQRIRTEVGIDNRRDGLRVNKVGRRKHLVVAHIHTLTHSASHTSQTYTELVVELLTYGAHTAVRQVVNIIHLSVAVNQLHQVLDNLNDILFGQHTHIVGDRHIQLAVDTIASHIAQVVALLREEEVLNHLSRRSVVSRLCVAQLAIDIEHCLFLGLGRVFLQGVEDNRVVALTILVLVQKHGLAPRLKDDINHLRRQFSLALYHNLVTLDGRHLTRILIYEIFQRGFHYISCQAATEASLQVGAITLHFLCQVEATQDVAVGLEADGAKQRGYGQLLLAVDIGIHHLVDIRSKLNP